MTGPVKEIEYDALGRKADEATTTTSGKILRTKYKYNIMGAIKELDATLFSEELYYEDSAPMRHLPAYNGNVSAMTWRAADDILLQRGYAYYYDGADRLTEAAYFENGNRTEKYGTAYEYDSGGNITRISRDGYAGNGKFETVDELGMEHDGNRLARVIDFGVDSKVNGAFQFRQQNGITEPYAYDANGNLTKDMYKGIDHISYNVMNMPEKLDFKTGESIAYIYDADGNKLGSMYIFDAQILGNTVLPSGIDIGNSGVTHPKGIGTASEEVSTQRATLRMSSRLSFAGNCIYDNGLLSKVMFDGGYVEIACPKGPLQERHYITDSQGNVRVVADEEGKAVQVNHYYPYGGLFAESTELNGQRYRFSGKELDRMCGLDWYFYGARWYDAAIGRWNTKDPLEEKYPWISPYAFCNNNPVKYIDPDGRLIVGARKSDAIKAVADLKHIFSDEKFKNFRVLIKNDGRTISKISNEAIALALNGINLTEDQNVLLEITINTINSNEVHNVKYLTQNSFLPNAIASEIYSASKGDFRNMLDNIIRKQGTIPSIYLNAMKAITIMTKVGTYSAIYLNNLSPIDRAIIFGHEIMGHGRSLVLGRTNYQDQDAIQFENLLNRILHTDHFNNGKNHGQGKIIPNAGDLPEYR